MQLNTQTSSKPRLKNDTLGNDALQRLYGMFESSLDLGQFKVVCEDTVQMGGGNQQMKDKIIREIRMATTKQYALTKVQNFILAGMGLGV